ncbi:hypothetical protein GCM10022409_03790 [Hymenobacter glaciei]|uniref:Nucleotidyltransferase family protein n=1 Tax=Hymenobacter glaciei TaxID=877209 RepID=A0ABP7TBR2_9BACT
MTAAHERLYLRTLHQLVAAGVPFGVWGTFALRQHCPTLPRRLVADCDLLLPPDPAILNTLTNVLQAGGWRVTLWEWPVSPPLLATELRGKYYLRARQASAVLDCTYENDRLDWPAFWANCEWQHGLPLLKPTAIMRQKRQLRRPTDLAVLRWWQQVDAPSAGSTASAPQRDAATTT